MRRVILFQAFVLASSSQSVTQPVRLSQESDVQSSNLMTDVPLSTKLCYVDEPACTNQISLYDECSAQYEMFDRLQYCLCTTGQYEAENECDKCEFKAGQITGTLGQMSSRRSVCASASVVYGNATSTPSDYNPGILITFRQTFTDSSTRSVLVPTRNLLSGLVANPSTAAPSSGPAIAAPTNAALTKLRGPGLNLQMKILLPLLSLEAILCLV
ncbi:MAG: hypothetical protein LQ342_002349 [Letrouitia transgressa]|nr:MAG: hypothetical protein LQ342_002349 [Letrouitia transgressa]